MRKILSFVIILMLVLSNVMTIEAYETKKYVEQISDDLYVEYVIEEFNTRATNTRRGTKTATMKDADENVLWTVTVTGSFEYDGFHSTCKTSSVSTTCPSTYWKITSKSATKSGASATAKATGTRYNNGVAVESHTQSVVLICGTDGTLY